MKKSRYIFYPLLVAWLIIFAHETIPHKHHHGFACSVEHPASTAGEDHAGVFQEQQSTGHQVCHFTVDILPGLSLDDDFAVPGTVRFIAPEMMEVRLRPFTIQINRNPIFLSQNLLRAPPAV